MRFWAIFRKCVTEHLRGWVLLLTALSMAPAFILIYSLVFNTNAETYGVLVLDHDEAVMSPQGRLRAADQVLEVLRDPGKHGVPAGLTVRTVKDTAEADRLLRAHEAEMLLTLAPNFSRSILAVAGGEAQARVPLGLHCDVTNQRYSIAAILVGTAVEGVVSTLSARAPLMDYQETQLGGSRVPTFFETAIPGLLVSAVIMLLFTAAIALVKEVESGTLVRLRMSAVRPLEYVAAVGLSEALVGVLGVALSLLLARALGFQPAGSSWAALLVAAVASVSMVAVALVVAAFTRSANDVLIVGNFPFFLMFFLSGSAFPLPRMVLFEAWGHAFQVNELLPATHAVVAMNRVLLQAQSISDVAYEFLAMGVLSVVYLVLGAWLFQRRHLAAR
jgi:ABC-2 type transport system permease protein